MAYVTILKKHEAIKIGDAVLILDSAKSAKIILDVDPDVVIQKLTKEDIKNGRYRKTALSK